MSKKQWLVLLMLFLSYLMLGAAIFFMIESRLEVEAVKKAREERIEINELLNVHYKPDPDHDQQEILLKLSEYCGKSVYNYTEGEVDPLKWDFYNSFYFAYTVVSTIGYGNLAPTSMLSRILMIFYALIGIPMNGILLTQLGEFFGNVFVKAHKKYKTYKATDDECVKKLVSLESRKAGFTAQILMYLIPGFVMFIFFPAFLFSYYEGWSYEEAVYYAFVTLTTIGFGDYVAGQDNAKGSGFFFGLYKTFLIGWISFGLGYIVMIMTFIARGMRSKKITRLEHKLAMNLKHTQSKIWNEFNKEVNYLRRVFNELQLSKVKRVYMDDEEYEAPPNKFLRSSSFPDLRQLALGGSGGLTDTYYQPPHPRRRANSEVVPAEAQVTRVVSETDLQRIDKTATFASHMVVQPAELLARLVNVLGYIPPPPDDLTEAPDLDEMERDNEPYQGVQGFTDKEILASEEEAANWHRKTGNDRLNFVHPRSRTASEVRLNSIRKDVGSQNGEWTWSGPAASRRIQELIKARKYWSSSVKEKETKSKFPSVPKAVSKTLLLKWMKLGNNKKVTRERTRNSVSVGDLGTDDLAHFESIANQSTASPAAGNLDDRRNSENRPYFTYTGAQNLAESLEGSTLLEETSMADFLRALTALHTRVGSMPEEFTARKPQRKMGTASLSPPKLPSLFTLFSPMPGTPAASQSLQNTITVNDNMPYSNRRFSLQKNDDNQVGQAAQPSYNYRRGSIAPVQRARRFSLRPASLNPAPFLPPPNRNAFVDSETSSSSDKRLYPIRPRNRTLSTSIWRQPSVVNSPRNSASRIMTPTYKSSEDKPRVSIESYKSQTAITIEKPSVNPFDQYRAVTSLSRDASSNLEEIKVTGPKPADNKREEDTCSATKF